MITVPDREVSLAQSKLAKEGTPGATLASGGQEIKFGTGVEGGDWFGWVWSLTKWSTGKMPTRCCGQRPPLLTLGTAISRRARGRLGTGLYGALTFVKTIRQMAAAGKFDIAMHLGDVYYSGTEDEVEERFLKVWPDEGPQQPRPQRQPRDVFGRRWILQKDLPKFNQESSYFAIQNEHWVLVGLDTAYVDHDIDTTQVAWLNTIVEQRGDRKVVLFSHQQPFSQLDNQGPKLQSALRHLLEANRVRAWYWGHQHDCIVYDEHAKWKMFGRCLGNGGIPSARNDTVKKVPPDPAFPVPAVPNGTGCRRPPTPLAASCSMARTWK